jgi:ubiquinone/menaquinone biosynthesis C-methylase UbiE
MGNSLKRIPEPAIMETHEENEFIKCNSAIFKGIHPLIQVFSKLCPSFSDKGVRILDVGSGVANMSVQFAMAYPKIKIVAVDASATMLQYSKAFVNHFKFNDRISIRCAWLPDADFGEPDNSFDLVFARSTLHHFIDPSDFWKGVERYAKYDAAIFIVDMLRPSGVARLNELVWQRFGTKESFIRNAFAASLLASHTMDEINNQLDHTGFDDLIIEPLPSFNVNQPQLQEETHVMVWRPGRFIKEDRK